MNRISFRVDTLITENSKQMKAAITDGLDYSRIVESWNEFINEIYGAIDASADLYIESRLSQTDVYRKKQQADAEWEKLEKSGGLSDEVADRLSNEYAKIEDALDDLEDDMRREFQKIRPLIVSDAIKGQMS